MEQIKETKRIYSLNLIAYVAYRTNLNPLLLLDEDGRTYYGVFPECSGVELAIEEFRQKKVRVELHRYLNMFRVIKVDIYNLKSRG